MEQGAFWKNWVADVEGQGDTVKAMGYDMSVPADEEKANEELLGMGGKKQQIPESIDPTGALEASLEMGSRNAKDFQVSNRFQQIVRLVQSYDALSPWIEIAKKDEIQDFLL